MHIAQVKGQLEEILKKSRGIFILFPNVMAMNGKVLT